jgi:dynein heavy chain, axonemal
MQIAVKTLQEAGNLNSTHLEFFLKGNLSLDKSVRKNPYPWFPETGWHDMMRLTMLGSMEGGNPALKEIADDIVTDEDSWKDYYSLEAPEAAPLPKGFEDRISPFEKLLVLRCIKMDRVTVRSVPSVCAWCGLQASNAIFATC